MLAAIAIGIISILNLGRPTRNYEVQKKRAKAGCAHHVFREVFEAGLIVGIVLAVTRSVPRRNRWIGGGVLAVATLRDGVLMHRPNRHRGRVVQTCWHEGAPNAQTLK